MSVGIAVTGVLLARLLGSVTQIVLARLLGVANFGLYTTLYTLLGPVIVITSLGLDTWLLRQGGSASTLDTTINQVFSLRLLTTGGLMLVVALVMALSGQTGLALPTGLAALALTGEMLLTTAQTALRAQIRNPAAAVLQVAAPGLTILLIWFFWSTQTPLLAATGYRLLGDSVGLALLFWFMRHSLSFVCWQPAQLLDMVKQARPYFAADLLASVALRADLTLVALLIGAVGAGIYSPALTIVNTTFLMPAVVYQVLLPVLSRQESGSRSFRSIMGLVLGASLLYGLLWAIALRWSSGLIIDLIFHAQYREAAPLLQIMSLIPLLKSLNFCWAMLMVVRDRQVLRTQLLAVGAVFNVVANLACIPLFGLTGAAWVNLATEVVLLVCYSVGAWISLRGRR